MNYIKRKNSVRTDTGICRRRLQYNIKYAKEFLQKKYEYKGERKALLQENNKTFLNTKGKP